MCISEYRAMRDVSHKAYLIHRVSFTETQNVQALGRALTHGDALHVLADTHDTPAPKDVSHIPYSPRRKPTSTPAVHNSSLIYWKFIYKFIPEYRKSALIFRKSALMNEQVSLPAVEHALHVACPFGNLARCPLRSCLRRLQRRRGRPRRLQQRLGHFARRLRLCEC